MSSTVKGTNMKIQVMSDLHMEFGGKLPKINRNTDVLIIAGDYCIYSPGWLRLLAETYFTVNDIIFVPGNHEYYDNNMTTIKQEMQKEASQLEHLHLLDRDYVILDDVVFIGATLWTDFDLYGISNKFRAINVAKKTINDFKRITVCESIRFSPQISINYHYEDKAFILDKLSVFQGRKVVVVTHHGPSEQSVDREKYEDDIQNASYVSNLESIISLFQPNLWIHGHVHHSVDKMLGDMRLIANPRGYKFAPNPDWDDNLTIDL